MNGIINVYKEKDYTSFDVVAVLRKILKMKKIGHTGTLDPMATGVLPICVGKATKVVDLLTDRKKTYRATLRFGIDTDTQDITGKVLREEEALVSNEQVKDALMSFIGDYDQVPPMYSALKHNGKRLYELARQGIEVERKSRRVQILNLSNITKITEIDYSFEVTCSKGTYIRTLIVDMAKKLDTIATMTALERIEVEPYTVDGALTLGQIRELVEQGDVNHVLEQVDSLFMDKPEIHMLQQDEKWLHNGSRFNLEKYLGLETNIIASNFLKIEESLLNKLASKSLTADQWIRVYDSTGRFIAIYITAVKENKLVMKPYKMFF